MNHGSQLEQKLKALGIKKKELAERLRVHPNTITLWLGKSTLEPTQRRRIADALQTPEMAIFNTLIVSEQQAVYGGSSHNVKPTKKLNAFQYCGLLSIKEDALELQRKWRSEW